MEILHNHQQDILHHENCPRCKLNAAAPALLEALEYLTKQIPNNLNVKKDFSLMLGKANAIKAITKAIELSTDTECASPA